MNETGNWIKINRGIRESWIWEDPRYLKWWIDILMMASYKDKKILVGKELIKIERGSFITSQSKLAERWNVDRRTVKRYLDLLQDAQMIVHILHSKKTIVKVLNYSIYQSTGESIRTTSGTDECTVKCTDGCTVECTQHRFFEQMDYLTPELLRVLKPGRVAAIHVKDRVLFGNATGTGMPTIEPFHAVCIEHYMKHGFQYFGMITVVTDVVRENNQTYRLGWSEQCKDGSKMGVGCPEYILLFRKLPTDRSTAYADTPVKKSKEDYTRAQWQIDAHAYWRSSGDCLISKEDLQNASVDTLQAVYREYSRDTVYNYDEHVALAKKLDTEDRLPATFMVVAPGSWNQLEVWDDINRMRTLNTTQSRRRAQMHVCPLQLDIVERIINRYSNEGDVVYDPFGGLMTVPMMAVKMHRYGKGCELNPDYFRDGVGYLEAAESEVDMPTLFDLFPEVMPEVADD